MIEIKTGKDEKNDKMINDLWKVVVMVLFDSIILIRYSRVPKAKAPVPSTRKQKATFLLF